MRRPSAGSACHAEGISSPGFTGSVPFGMQPASKHAASATAARCVRARTSMRVHMRQIRLLVREVADVRDLGLELLGGASLDELAIGQHTEEQRHEEDGKE